MRLFWASSPMLGRFYLPPTIHKRLCNVPRRSYLSYLSYPSVMLYLVRDTILKTCQNFWNIITSLWHKTLNQILRTPFLLHKLDVLPSLPEYVISCKIDVMGLYPSISQEDELIAMQQKSLES